ncbi:hypothetical protein Pcinc_024027 [Petrolisthes cinctipes]|uniref:Uncharacterized protein n=1 Tax=Petrolisthes cinctipes TaxID=88211 RepID=A0AAE1FC88_PETCI|nr:hypothetical protein Pcinc_024027 [Petrolisthes cinctipes]
MLSSLLLHPGTPTFLSTPSSRQPHLPPYSPAPLSFSLPTPSSRHPYLPPSLLPRSGTPTFLPPYSLVLAPPSSSLPILPRPGTPNFLPPYSLVPSPPSVSTQTFLPILPGPGTPTFLSTRQHPSLPPYSPLPSSPPLGPDTPPTSCRYYHHCPRYRTRRFLIG